MVVDSFDGFFHCEVTGHKRIVRLGVAQLGVIMGHFKLIEYNPGVVDVVRQRL
ncbi:hypothetical protein [uncultured Duncaniella sp.]|uniref:hypothetical protein n=1 Tax=uncultured Duncaniella sp. TaxID=2768039 RepID=UPI0025E91648|nr:hypothetical protein [uncultured Duncaniella sp.]